MGFLIRIGFWFSVVLLLLPLGPDGRSDGAGAIQAFVAASEALADVAGMCERKPDVCETGLETMHVIGVRALEGARIALGLLGDAPDLESTTGSIAADDDPGHAP